jgi:hypothetical protein
MLAAPSSMWRHRPGRCSYLVAAQGTDEHALRLAYFPALLRIAVFRRQLRVRPRVNYPSILPTGGSRKVGDGMSLFHRGRNDNANRNAAGIFANRRCDSLGTQ